MAHGCRRLAEPLGRARATRRNPTFLVPGPPVGVQAGAVVKTRLPKQETWEVRVQSLRLEDPLEEEIIGHSRIRKPHGQRSLAGCSPWARTESDMA